jgi:hypothetical protein
MVNVPHKTNAKWGKFQEDEYQSKLIKRNYPRKITINIYISGLQVILFFEVGKNILSISNFITQISHQQNLAMIVISFIGLLLLQKFKI